jgi:hypothetical protein
MKLNKLFFGILISLTFSTGAISVARGQALRTFVSAQHGNDTNISTNCALTTPCRTFSAAIGVTSPGGEVVVLDSGGYGPFTVSHAIQIEAPPGVYAGVSGDGITVAAGSSDEVVIRGLTINGPGGGGIGAGQQIGSLVVDGCVFDGLGYGVIYQPLSPASLLVENSTFRNCQEGILVGGRGMTGPLQATVDHCRFFSIGDNAITFAVAGQFLVDSVEIQGCGNDGVEASNLANAYIRDTNMSGCLQAGIEVDVPSNVTAVHTSVVGSFMGFITFGSAAAQGTMGLLLDGCTAMNDMIGVESSSSTAPVAMKGCTVTQCQTGVDIDTGTSLTFTNPGTNYISGNTTDVQGTPGTAPALR